MLCVGAAHLALGKLLVQPQLALLGGAAAAVVISPWKGWMVGVPAESQARALSVSRTWSGLFTARCDTHPAPRAASRRTHKSQGDAPSAAPSPGGVQLGLSTQRGDGGFQGLLPKKDVKS